MIIKCDVCGIEFEKSGRGRKPKRCKECATKERKQYLIDFNERRKLINRYSIGTKEWEGNRLRLINLGRILIGDLSIIIPSPYYSLIGFCEDCNVPFIKVANQIRCDDCKSKYDIRNDYQFIQWSKDVKVRDEFKCQVCGSTDDLESHHIIAVSKDLSLAFELSNGITLCSKHHRINLNSVHRILGTQGTKTSFSVWFESVKASF